MFCHVVILQKQKFYILSMYVYKYESKVVAKNRKKGMDQKDRKFISPPREVGVFFALASIKNKIECVVNLSDMFTKIWRY